MVRAGSLAQLFVGCIERWLRGRLFASAGVVSWRPDGRLVQLRCRTTDTGIN
jgi:hypothetical protein